MATRGVDALGEECAHVYNQLPEVLERRLQLRNLAWPDVGRVKRRVCSRDSHAMATVSTADAADG
jgi:hypothetical protein